jgi:hypothetical protein
MHTCHTGAGRGLGVFHWGRWGAGTRTYKASQEQRHTGEYHPHYFYHPPLFYLLLYSISFSSSHLLFMVFISLSLPPTLHTPSLFYFMINLFADSHTRQFIHFSACLLAIHSLIHSRKLLLIPLFTRVHSHPFTQTRRLHSTSSHLFIPLPLHTSTSSSSFTSLSIGGLSCVTSRSVGVRS